LNEGINVISLNRRVHEKHAVTTWTSESITAHAWRHTKTKKTLAERPIIQFWNSDC